jgi:hypothetical protein
MTPLTAAAYVIPPFCAILLATRARSKAARAILTPVGLFCLCLFAILMVGHLNCDYSDFTFNDCSHLPNGIRATLGPLQSLFALFYLFAGPVLLVISALAEMIARSRV